MVQSAQLVFQMLGWLGVYALVSAQNYQGRTYTRPSGTNGKRDWRNLLRDATFESLSRYTGYTPSLDDKIERDAILWNKIHSAEFLSTGWHINTDHTQSGTLLVAENGDYKFSERDLPSDCHGLRCQPIDNSLLTYWKVQTNEPNSVRIHIKVPFDQRGEDVYEYTDRYGLKQINQKDVRVKPQIQQQNQNFQQYRNDKEQESSFQSRELDAKPKYGNGEALYVVQYPQGGNEETFIHSYMYDGSMISKSEENDQYPPWGGQYNRETSEVNTYTTTKAYKNENAKPQQYWLTEFNPNPQKYDGFVPSMGPTGSTPTYKNVPIYNKNNQYNADFISEYRETVNQYFQKPKTNTNFKPSAQFVKYSEPDPFYSSQETPNDYSGEVNYKYNPESYSAQPAKYPQPVYTNLPPELSFHSVKGVIKQLPNSTTEQEQSMDMYKSISMSYEIQSAAAETIESIPKNTDTNTHVEKNKTEEENKQVTDYKNTDDQNSVISTTEENKQVTDYKNTDDQNSVVSTTEKNKDNIKKQVKHQPKTEFREKTTNNREKGKIPTLFPQWGERIKTSTQRNIVTPRVHIKKTQNAHTKSIQNIDLQETLAETETKISTNQHLENTTQTNANNIIANDSSQQNEEKNSTFQDNKFSKENIKTIVEKEQKHKNIEINDVVDKTPEEIVSALTSMGLLNNATIKKLVQSLKTNSSQILKIFNLTDAADILYSDQTDLLSENKAEEQIVSNNRTQESITKEALNRDTGNELDKNDSEKYNITGPVSIIVNRISKSYSYKTSKGQTGNLKHSAIRKSTKTS